MLDRLEEVVVTARRAFPQWADLQVIERPGWLQIVTPSLKTGGLNEVIYSLLDEHGADAAIDTAIAIYRDRGLKFRWNAGPGSGPIDLGERLERRGLTPSRGRGMARSTDVGDAGDASDVAGVVEVDRATVGDYTRVMASGWSAESAPLLALHHHLLAEGRQRLFVAYCDGVAAAAGSYVAFARSAFLMRGVVVEAFRGRGLYRALVEARLRHARGRGISIATTHARESTSAPILEKLGFETVCSIPMYFG
ncbi:MAG: GNAT family N-acetyltransferase [Kofleriaceae bacterium]